MTVGINTTATDIVIGETLTDVRGQEQRTRLSVDPALTDTALAAFLTHLDAVTNAAIGAEIITSRAANGLKSPAVDATEANISEMMEIILSGIDPVTGRKVSRPVRIGSMVRAAENFPAGTLNTSNTDIAAIVTFLNAHYAYIAPDKSVHVGLLQVDTAASHHVTVDDIVDIS